VQRIKECLKTEFLLPGLRAEYDVRQVSDEMMIVLYLLSMLLAQQPQPEFGSLSGQVRGMGGEVAAGIRVAAAPVTAGVAVSPASIELSNIVQTDGEGRYRLENVRPGLYLIVAGSMTSPSYYPVGTRPTEGMVVAVAAGQAITKLDITIAPSSVPLITGTARFDDNTPVTNDALYRTGLQLRFTRTGSDRKGSASLDRLQSQPGVLVFYGIDSPGTYAVTVDPLPLGYFVKSMTYGSTDLTRYPLVLTAKLGNPIVDIVLSKTRPAGTPPGVKVSGRVVIQDPAGPKPSRLISLFRLQDNTYVYVALVDTMDDGTFEIDGVPPGNYAMAPNQPANLQPNRPRFKGTIFDVGGNDVRNLEVKIGQPEYPITLTSGKTGTVKGSVDIAAIPGGTIPEFEIQFVPTRDGDETRVVKISSREFSALLPEGAYRVRISGLPTGYTVESVIAGPMDLTEPFLVTAAGIADRLTGVRIKSDGIAIKLSSPPK